MLSIQCTVLPSVHICIKFFKDFIYFILRGREEEGEKHQCVVASGMSPTGDLTHNPGIYPDRELNEHPFGLQAGAHLLSHTSQGVVVKLLFKV